MRLGVVADPHLSLHRVEDAGWHNPYRLVDAHERLVDALAHRLVASADAIAILGDLAHFGDAASIRFVVDAVAATGVPAVLISGNHDVLEPGVRLEHEVEAARSATVTCPRGAPPVAVVDAFRDGGLGLELHEVMDVARRPVRPFDVESAMVVDAPDAPALVLTHFPVLSVERRCRDEQLLYSGHLDQLALPPSIIPSAPGRPTIVLSGHLHLRAVTTESSVLQLIHAALVEPPYEVAAVDIDVVGDEVVVRYECASVIPPDAKRIPVIDPAEGTWTYRGGGWSCERTQPPYDASSKRMGSAKKG